MAYKMEREKTGSTPYILIDEENKYMKLEGESFHENVVEFFKEVNSWLDNFLETNFDSLTFDCELKYFNSSTAKLLLNILLAMDDSGNSKNIIVNWITTDNNDIIIECGEDFKEDLSNLQFNLIVN